MRQLGKEQHGRLMLFQPLPQIVGIRKHPGSYRIDPILSGLPFVTTHLVSRIAGIVRVIAEITAPAHSCARGFSAPLHVTEPALIARILEHRDGRNDVSGKAPAGGARAPLALSLH